MRYLVTGCNSDIGKALTEILAEKKKNKVLLISRSKAEDHSFHPNCECKRIGGIDLTNIKHLKSIATEASCFFNGPFTVIHSVGDFWQHRPLDECSPDIAKKMFMSHYLTLYGVLYSLLPIMCKKHGGRFIAFSCNSVQYNYPEMAPFTSAKAAVECLIKCVANEYSEMGIQANVLALPTIRTKKVEQTKPQGDFDNYIKPLELAKVVICEIDNISKFVNGNVIKVFRHSHSFYGKSYFVRNPSGRTRNIDQIKRKEGE